MKGNVFVRFGRRSHKKKKSYDMVVVSDGSVLPLLDCGHDDSECARKTKRRVFKLASRCQVRTINDFSASKFPVTRFPLFEGGQSKSQHSDDPTSGPSCPSAGLRSPFHRHLCTPSRH